MKRAYFVSDSDGEQGIAVIATSVKEAKKIAWGNDALCNEEFIDVTAKWVKGVNCEKFRVGVMEDYVEALRLGIYGHVEDEECPKCEKEGTLTRVEFKNKETEVMCYDCEEKNENKDNKT